MPTERSQSGKSTHCTICGKCSRERSRWGQKVERRLIVAEGDGWQEGGPKIQLGRWRDRGDKNAPKQTGDVSTILSNVQKLWNHTVKWPSCIVSALFPNKKCYKKGCHRTQPLHGIEEAWKGHTKSREFSLLPSGCG